MTATEAAQEATPTVQDLVQDKPEAIETMKALWAKTILEKLNALNWTKSAAAKNLVASPTDLTSIYKMRLDKMTPNDLFTILLRIDVLKGRLGNA